MESRVHLTGRFSFQQTLFGRLVLRVEEECKPFWPWANQGTRRTRWRKARVMDLTKLELRALIELGHRTQPMDGRRYPRLPVAAVPALPAESPGASSAPPLARPGDARESADLTLAA